MRGLLALDPQLTIDATDHARFDDPDDSDQVHEVRELGGFAKPDSFIQFFLAPEAKTSDEFTQAYEPLTPRSPHTLTAIGTVPPEVEKVQAPGPQVRKTPRHPTQIRLGHFGAVSESGLFLRSAAVGDQQQGRAEEPSQQTRVLSKISSPYSYFYRDFRSPRYKEREKLRLALMGAAHPVRKVASRQRHIQRHIRRVQSIAVHAKKPKKPKNPDLVRKVSSRRQRIRRVEVIAARAKEPKEPKEPKELKKPEELEEPEEPKEPKKLNLVRKIWSRRHNSLVKEREKREKPNPVRKAVGPTHSP